MKIKNACEQTGLTDRTIRYYIEEGLISPDIKENYIGRKSIDFSDDDITALRDISILRKFGFSISDIKAIQSNSMNSIQIIRGLKEKKRSEIEENTNMVETLNQLDSFSEYQFQNLAVKLAEIAEKRDLPDEDKFEKVKLYIRSIPKMILSILASFPPLVFVILAFKRYLYPDFSWWSAVALLLTIIPTIVGMKILFSKNNHYGILAACIVYLPISFIFSLFAFNSSTTTKLNNYLIMDSNIREDEIFPGSAHTFENVQDENGHFSTKYLDAKYYYHYHCGLDDTYDIYAEWPLEKDDFYREVERQRKIFEKKREENELNDNNEVYAEVNHGSYRCLIENHMNTGDQFFSEVTNSYYYSIFAYDEEACRVRYISCYSLEDGTEQPYYLQLDW